MSPSSSRVSVLAALLLCACAGGDSPEASQESTLREGTLPCPIVKLEEIRTTLVGADGARIAEEIVVCKQCLSEKREPIGDRTCSSPEPAPSDVKCSREVAADGRVCARCIDATGQVVKDDCAPAPSGGDVRCERRVSDDGSRVCYRCVDASGVVVKEGCEPAASGGDVTCERRVSDDGSQVCYRCVDASGVVVKEACEAK